ncbi:hypothetical protein, partial [Klebsiella pneumoniae]|uniref:hypothetical protein n=1 Tax=Klebsiella pneumoniae TaxID=573 RepID=UPI003B98543F
MSLTKRKVEFKSARYNTKAHRIFQTYIADWEREKQQQSKKSKKGYKSSLSFCPPCIESILNRPCPEGFRNHTAAALASYFKQRGYSKDKGWKAIVQWNEEYAKLPTGELQTT